MGQGVLARVLAALPAPDDPRVLVASAHADDAGVFRLSETEALVATVDFFTPIVDDPYRYGAIAAANSLSDVYAMGGEPLFALAIAAFPDDPAVLALLPDVMAGAADKAREAGICIIGGHTVKDAEPKFGLAVTGRVDPRSIWTNRDAREGDRIVLTKPLGTGVVTTAIKWGMAPGEAAEAAMRSMERLNAAAARAGRTAGIRTATDVTGYGLLGHLLEVLEASDLCATIVRRDVPLLPGVRDLLAARRLAGLPGRLRLPGLAPWLDRTFGAAPIPGGARDNLGHQRGKVDFRPPVPPDEELLLADPQTSGGLLMFVPPDRADRLLAALAASGEEGWAIGQVAARPSPAEPRIVVA